jgi:protein-disulfide isomerase
MKWNPAPIDRRKIASALFLAIVCVVSVEIAHFRATPPGVASPSKRLLARSKGKPANPLWIVEYMDFQCINCREVGATVDAAMKAHPDTIYFEARFLPLIRTHRLALKSAIYAECAARHGRFWPMSDLLFAKQAEWAESQDPDVLFEGYAREAGLDARRLSACVSDVSVKAAVLEERERARALGLSATPSFFVNGKKMVGVEALREELDAYFKEGKSAS